VSSRTYLHHRSPARTSTSRPRRRVRRDVCAATTGTSDGIKQLLFEFRLILYDRTQKEVVRRQLYSFAFFTWMMMAIRRESKFEGSVLTRWARQPRLESTVLMRPLLVVVGENTKMCRWHLSTFVLFGRKMCYERGRKGRPLHFAGAVPLSASPTRHGRWSWSVTIS
jgi:hypothetical protein